MLISLSLIPVGLSNKILSPLVCLLPEEPHLLVVFCPLGAALEDEVVEVGAGCAGDAQDVEGADLLALMLVPMLYLLHALRLLRSCVSLDQSPLCRGHDVIVCFLSTFKLFQSHLSVQ